MTPPKSPSAQSVTPPITPRRKRNILTPTEAQRRKDHILGTTRRDTLKRRGIDPTEPGI